MNYSTLIFSETILTFLQTAKKKALLLLSEEVGIKVGRSRFYYGPSSYPLNLVAFEHPTQLGYFQSEFYEIGLSKRLLFESDLLLTNVLRHELAHYLVFIEHGLGPAAHGKEFQEVCKRYGWGKKISLAYQALPSALKPNKKEKIYSKVQKLLSLAESHNTQEAESAMLKAHELLVKHNLENLPLLGKPNSNMHLIRLFEVKKTTAKLQAIATILRHYFVYPVFNHGRGKVYLEVFGKRVNVEIAEYVASFLFKELDVLWKKATELKGLRSKNSFFRGIAEGYKEKVDKQKKNEKALLALEKNLTDSLSMVYPNLSSTQCRHQHDPHATEVGRKAGKSLQIHPGIQEKKKFLIT